MNIAKNSKAQIIPFSTNKELETGVFVKEWLDFFIGSILLK